jgi:hypothetical protein
LSWAVSDLTARGTICDDRLCVETMLLPPCEARMPTTPVTNATDDHLTGMSTFVAECAEADAVRVGEFLRKSGIAPQQGQSRSLPAAHLLDLGAAMRIAAWEEAGLDVHRQVGLPVARDAICLVLLSPLRANRVPDKAAPNPSLLTAVLRLLIERFAWSGCRDLGAEVVLDSPDEDSLVEAIAQFLWAHRRLASTLDQGAFS